MTSYTENEIIWPTSKRKDQKGRNQQRLKDHDPLLIIAHRGRRRGEISSDIERQADEKNDFVEKPSVHEFLLSVELVLDLMELLVHVVRVGGSGC